MTDNQRVAEIEAEVSDLERDGYGTGIATSKVRFLLSALKEAQGENERLREGALKAWCHIDQDICVRWGSFEDYSLTEFRHGIRVEFNDILGIDEKLESAFQNGQDAPTSITTIVSKGLPFNAFEDHSTDRTDESYN